MPTCRKPKGFDCCFGSRESCYDNYMDYSNYPEGPLVEIHKIYNDGDTTFTTTLLKPQLRAWDCMVMHLVLLLLCLTETQLPDSWLSALGCECRQNQEEVFWHCKKWTHKHIFRTVNKFTNTISWETSILPGTCHLLNQIFAFAIFSVLSVLCRTRDSQWPLRQVCRCLQRSRRTATWLRTARTVFSWCACVATNCTRRKFRKGKSRRSIVVLVNSSHCSVRNRFPHLRSGYLTEIWSAAMNWQQQRSLTRNWRWTEGNQGRNHEGSSTISGYFSFAGKARRPMHLPRTVNTLLLLCSFRDYSAFTRLPMRTEIRPRNLHRSHGLHRWVESFHQRVRRVGEANGF